MTVLKANYNSNMYLYLVSIFKMFRPKHPYITLKLLLPVEEAPFEFSKAILFDTLGS